MQFVLTSRVIFLTKRQIKALHGEEDNALFTE